MDEQSHRVGRRAGRARQPLPGGRAGGHPLLPAPSALTETNDSARDFQIVFLRPCYKRLAGHIEPL